MPIKQILSSLLLRLLLQLFKVCVLATECVILIEKVGNRLGSKTSACSLHPGGG